MRSVTSEKELCMAKARKGGARKVAGKAKRAVSKTAKKVGSAAGKVLSAVKPKRRRRKTSKSRA
jgi:hypothetical protein